MENNELFHNMQIFWEGPVYGGSRPNSACGPRRIDVLLDFRRGAHQAVPNYSAYGVATFDAEV